MPARPFEAYPGNEPYVFVSYAHADRNAIYPELKWLHDAGYRIWYDEGIPPSENWVGVIPQRIITCTVVLAFMSPSAVASKWVRKELNLADRRNLPILPVYLSDTQIDAELDFQIGSTQSLFRHQLNEAEFRTRLDRQLRQFAGLIDPILSPVESFTIELQRTISAERDGAPAGYTLASWVQPGSTVGSELHESRILADGRWLVVVGDVAGKGPQAALLGTVLTGMLDVAVARSGIALAPAIAQVNAAFRRRAGDRFATLSAVLIDPRAHKMTAVSAGQMPPVLRRGSGKPWAFPDECVGLPLGVLPNAVYKSIEAKLYPGDTLLIVSDGVLDAMKLAGTAAGSKGLRPIMERVTGAPSRVVASLRDAVISYTEGRRFTDDVTVVCLGRSPPANGKRSSDRPARSKRTRPRA
jgi:serine phosphatase RsbU (regulator of sigma subunit)